MREEAEANEKGVASAPASGNQGAVPDGPKDDDGDVKMDSGATELARVATTMTNLIDELRMLLRKRWVCTPISLVDRVNCLEVFVAFLCWRYHQHGTRPHARLLVFVRLWANG